MKPNLQDLEALIRAANELKRAQVAFEKKSVRARDVDANAGARSVGKADADMHWAGMHVDRCWDTLHARAVDLGLREPLPADSYRPREVQWSRMHGQTYQPAVPRCIAQPLSNP